MKKLLFLLLLIISVLVLVNVSGSKRENKVSFVAPTIAKPIITVGLPKKLTIPNLGIQTAVEFVGLDFKGRMGVPKNSDNVAWYKLGRKPGEKGNAVMAGHFDKQTGEPAVFFNLRNLKKGDKVIVVDEKNKKYNFVVTKIANYPYDNFPLQEIFGEAESRRLNLITCEGKWDSINKNYSHRTVVYSVLAE